MSYIPFGPNVKSNPYYERRNHVKLAKGDYNKSMFFGTVGGQPELGPETILTNEFNSDTNWFKGLGWTIANGIASCSGAQASASDLINQNGMDYNGLDVRVAFVLETRTAGILSIQFGAQEFGTFTVPGLYYEFGTVTDPGLFGFQADGDFIGSISIVSVREVL